jgi:CRISPR-associated protein Cas2
MYVIVFYDVSSNRIRKKIGDACLDYGLDRTQFSAFVGDIAPSHQRELMLKLQNLLGDQPGALLLIPIDRKEWNNRLEFRQDAPGDGLSTFASSIADRETLDGELF